LNEEIYQENIHMKKNTSSLTDIRKVAEQGDATAQYKLGYCYDYGAGVGKNAVEAMKWYRTAAEQGNAAAQNNLAEMYRNGRGIPQSDAEAVKWYSKAAEQGDAFAQFRLEKMKDK
jgi:TPR repeat protein